MALLKSRTKEVPEDAVILSEDEALKFQMDIVQNWDKTSDKIAIKFGPYVLSSAAILSGAFYNNHFRTKFLLGGYGRMSSYLPVCFLPGVLSLLLHTELVLKPIMLMKGDECPVCIESRAAAIQACVSVVYPLIIAPIGCAALAARYSTYDVPVITRQPKEAFSVFAKMFRKINTKSLYLLIGQAFLGSVITHFEASNLITITNKFTKITGSTEEFLNG